MSVGDIFIVIAPVFAVIFLGIFLGRTPLFETKGQDDQISAALIRYVNFIAIPALLIRALANRELPQPEELILIAGYYSGMYVVYFLTVFLVARWLKQKPEERAMSGMIACFVNIGFVGLPIAEKVYGSEGVRLFLIIMSFHSLTLIPTTLVLMARARNRGGAGFNPIAMVKSNPVLISLCIGLSWSALKLPFPDWLDQILELPAQSAAPVGLFAGGLALSRISLAGAVKDISTLTFVKLCVMPVAVWITSRFVFDLPGLYVAIAVLMAALPSGLIPYMLAMNEKVAPRRAASTLLLTVLLAPISLSAVLYLIGIKAL